MIDNVLDAYNISSATLKEIFPEHSQAIEDIYFAKRNSSEFSEAQLNQLEDIDFEISSLMSHEKYAARIRNYIASYPDVIGKRDVVEAPVKVKKESPMPILTTKELEDVTEKSKERAKKEATIAPEPVIEESKEAVEAPEIMNQSEGRYPREGEAPEYPIVEDIDLSGIEVPEEEIIELPEEHEIIAEIPVIEEPVIEADYHMAEEDHLFYDNFKINSLQKLIALLYIKETISPFLDNDTLLFTYWINNQFSEKEIGVLKEVLTPLIEAGIVKDTLHPTAYGSKIIDLLSKCFPLGLHPFNYVYKNEQGVFSNAIIEETNIRKGVYINVDGFPFLYNGDNLLEITDTRFIEDDNTKSDEFGKIFEGLQKRAKLIPCKPKAFCLQINLDDNEVHVNGGNGLGYIIFKAEDDKELYVDNLVYNYLRKEHGDNLSFTWLKTSAALTTIAVDSSGRRIAYIICDERPEKDRIGITDSHQIPDEKQLLEKIKTDYPSTTQFIEFNDFINIDYTPVPVIQEKVPVEIKEEAVVEAVQAPEIKEVIATSPEQVYDEFHQRISDLRTLMDMLDKKKEKAERKEIKQQIDDLKIMSEVMFTEEQVAEIKKLKEGGGVGRELNNPNITTIDSYAAIHYTRNGSELVDDNGNLLIKSITKPELYGSEGYLAIEATGVKLGGGVDGWQIKLNEKGFPIILRKKLESGGGVGEIEVVYERVADFKKKPIRLVLLSRGNEQRGYTFSGKEAVAVLNKYNRNKQEDLEKLWELKGYESNKMENGGGIFDIDFAEYYDALKKAGYKDFRFSTVKERKKHKVANDFAFVVVDKYGIEEYFNADGLKSEYGHLVKGESGIPNQYEGKSDKTIWNNWTTYQKLHFLQDHFPRAVGDERRKIADMDFDKAMESYPDLYQKFEAHIIQGSYAKGGEIENLEKELHRLQRDLNSRRLNTYIEGDTSEEEKARQRERAAKEARFNEVLRLLREKEKNSSTYAKGGGIEDFDSEGYSCEVFYRIATNEGTEITVKKEKDGRYALFSGVSNIGSHPDLESAIAQADLVKKLKDKKSGNNIIERTPLNPLGLIKGQEFKDNKGNTFKILNFDKNMNGYWGWEKKEGSEESLEFSGNWTTFHAKYSEVEKMAGGGAINFREDGYSQKVFHTRVFDASKFEIRKWKDGRQSWKLWGVFKDGKLIHWNHSFDETKSYVDNYSSISEYAGGGEMNPKKVIANAAAERRIKDLEESKNGLEERIRQAETKLKEDKEDFEKKNHEELIADYRERIKKVDKTINEINADIKLESGGALMEDAQGDADNDERFGKSGTVEVKPRHASRDDVQELLNYLDSNSWGYKRAETNTSRQQSELPYIQISTTNVSREEVAELKKYLEAQHWEFSNLYAGGGEMNPKKAIANAATERRIKDLEESKVRLEEGIRQTDENLKVADEDWEKKLHKEINAEYKAKIKKIDKTIKELNAENSMAHGGIIHNVPEWYYKEFTLKGNGKRKYNIFQSHSDQQLKQAAKQIAPQMTYEEHKQWAEEYQGKMKKEKLAIEKLTEHQFQKQFGRPMEVYDYKVSGISREEFPEDIKSILRAMVDRERDYRSVYYFHAAQLNKRDKDKLYLTMSDSSASSKNVYASGGSIEGTDITFCDILNPDSPDKSACDFKGEIGGNKFEGMFDTNEGTLQLKFADTAPPEVDQEKLKADLRAEIKRKHDEESRKMAFALGDEYGDGGEVSEWMGGTGMKKKDEIPHVTGTMGLHAIREYSKKYPKNIYEVTDDNYSNIGNYWLKDGKFARVETWGNPLYDLANHKVSLRAKEDVIYKVKRVNKENFYKEGGGIKGGISDADKEMMAAAIQQATEIATIAYNKGIVAKNLSFEEFHDKIFYATHISYPKADLKLAYESMKAAGYKEGGAITQSDFDSAPLTEQVGEYYIIKNTEGNNHSFKTFAEGGLPFFVTTREGAATYKAESREDALDWINQRTGSEDSIKVEDTVIGKKNTTWAGVKGKVVFVNENILTGRYMDIILDGGEYVAVKIDDFEKSISNEDIDKQLLGYATEDVELCEKQGMSAITDTKYGLLDLSCSDGIFTITQIIDRVNNTPVLYKGDKAGAIQFIKNAYTVEYKRGGTVNNEWEVQVPYGIRDKESGEANRFGQTKDYTVTANNIDDAEAAAITMFYEEYDADVYQADERGIYAEQVKDTMKRGGVIPFKQFTNEELIEYGRPSFLKDDKKWIPEKEFVRLLQERLSSRLVEQLNKREYTLFEFKNGIAVKALRSLLEDGEQYGYIVSEISEMPDSIKSEVDNLFKKSGGSVLPSISEVESDGEEIIRYPIDEGYISNAGDAVDYKYKGKKYYIYTWNERAEDHKAGSKEIHDASDDSEMKSGGSVGSCPSGMQLQTVLFNKKSFTKESAKGWLDKHNYKSVKVDDKKNFLRFRQEPPTHFISKKFRTISWDGENIKAVVGCPKKKWAKKKKSKKKDEGGEVDWIHPEIREDEIFLINIKPDEQWDEPSFISEFRVGEVAYTTNGEKVVPDMKPLFGKLKTDIKYAKGGDIDDDLKTAIDAVYDAAMKDKFTSVNIGVIGENLAKHIYYKTNFNLKGYNVIITSDAIKHIIKKHGDEATEAKRSQLPITRKDFYKVLQIVLFPNEIKHGDKENSVVFTKIIGDEYWVIKDVVELTSRNKTMEGKLILNTMYIKKLKLPTK